MYTYVNACTLAGPELHQGLGKFPNNLLMTSCLVIHFIFIHLNFLKFLYDLSYVSSAEGGAKLHL